MSSSSDQAKTFRMLEQPCALRTRDEPIDLRHPGRAYDLTLADSDYGTAAQDGPAADGAAPDGKRPKTGRDTPGGNAERPAERSGGPKPR